MTEKLFYQDSHMKEFDAEVLSCEVFQDKNGRELYRVVLDRTAFFPEGGGQTADTGYLETARVLDVQEQEERIYHMTDSALQPGKTVHGRIDWKERFSKMQQHTGEHILSGLVHRIYGYDNVGFHLGNENVTLDFNGVLTREQMREIESLANEAAARNLEVQVNYPSKEELCRIDYRSKIEIEGQVRLVTIPGYDVCACCAPHVKQTGEIGLIKLIGMQNYKGGVRITIRCGDRALADYNAKEASVKAVSHMLSAREDQIVEAVHHLQEEIFRLNGEKERLMSQILRQKAEQLSEGEEYVWLFEENLDGNQMREYVNLVLERKIGICALFNRTETGSYRYVIASHKKDVRPFAKQLNAACSGKGGGKPEMVQGQAAASQEEISRCLKKISRHDGE